VIVPVESVPIDEDKLETEFDKLDETSRIISDKLVTDVLVSVESVPIDEDKLETEVDKFDETS
jgi:hypothetical protein